MHQRKRCDIRSNLPTLYELEILDSIETEPCDFTVDSDFQDIYSTVAANDLYRPHNQPLDTTECDIQSDLEEIEIDTEKMQQDLLETLAEMIPKTFIPCGHSEVDVVRGATQYIMCLSTILQETSSLNNLENNAEFLNGLQKPNEDVMSNPCAHYEFCDISQSEINATCCNHLNCYPNYYTPPYTETRHPTNSYTSLKSRNTPFCLSSPPLPSFSNVFEKYAYAYRQSQNPALTNHNPVLSRDNWEGFMSQPLCGLSNSSSLQATPLLHKENMLPCCAVASMYDSYKSQSELCTYDYPVLTSMLTNQNTCGRERKRRPRKRKANRNTGKENTTNESVIYSKENDNDGSETNSYNIASDNIFDIGSIDDTDAKSNEDTDIGGTDTGVTYPVSNNTDEVQETITFPSENIENRLHFVDGNNNDTKADDTTSAVQHEMVDSTTDVIENESDVDHFVSEKGLKRPKNGFIRFSVEYRKNLSANQPKMDNREVSRMLGAKWRKMSEEERRPYEEEFQNDIKEIRDKYPEWKYGPTKKPYHELIEPMPSRLRPREKLKRKFKPFIKRTLKKTEYTKRTKPKTEVLPVQSHHQVEQLDSIPPELTDRFSMHMGYQYTWMQCGFCLKHRRVPVTDGNRNQSFWTCHMNPDERYNSCSKEEEICPTLPTVSKPETSQCQSQPFNDYNNNSLNIGRFCTSGHFLYNVPTWSSIKHMY